MTLEECLLFSNCFPYRKLLIEEEDPVEGGGKGLTGPKQAGAFLAAGVAYEETGP